MANIFRIDERGRGTRTWLKSAIDVRAEVLFGEDPGRLTQLAEEYTERFRPTTPVERFFVDVLIRAEWRLRRFAKAGSDRLQTKINATQISYVRALRELERLQSNGGPRRGKTAALAQPRELGNDADIPRHCA